MSLWHHSILLPLLCPTALSLAVPEGLISRVFQVWEGKSWVEGFLEVPESSEKSQEETHQTSCESQDAPDSPAYFSELRSWPRLPYFVSRKVIKKQNQTEGSGSPQSHSGDPATLRPWARRHGAFTYNHQLWAVRGPSFLLRDDLFIHPPSMRACQ